MNQMAVDAVDECGQSLNGLPLMDLGEASAHATGKPSYAMVFMGCFGEDELRGLLDKVGMAFSQTILVPGYAGASSLWVTALDVGGILGLMVRQNLLDENRLRMKRALDLMLSALLMIGIVPLLLLITLAIRLESSGPILFRQTRVGRSGRHITIWKFRTMVADAEAQLAKCLREQPELRREWECDQKLKHDPRVTRVGRLLRRTSLDELPQIFNVLAGDLSLVGPRPIVDEEIVKYREEFELYKRVRPGITGLWQVSGRNSLSYDERVDLDRYYICNWSVWFDIYILARTVPEVLLGRGAC